MEAVLLVVIVLAYRLWWLWREDRRATRTRTTTRMTRTRAQDKEGR